MAGELAHRSPVQRLGVMDEQCTAKYHGDESAISDPCVALWAPCWTGILSSGTGSLQPLAGQIGWHYSGDNIKMPRDRDLSCGLGCLFSVSSDFSMTRDIEKPILC